MTAAAVSSARRAGWPYPIELTRPVSATSAMPMPHAVSTTLCLTAPCLPAFSATANVTAIMTSSAAAVASRVTTNGPAGRPLTGRA